MRRILCSIVGLLVSATSSLAAPPSEEVTTCGQVVERRGHLVADLDCSGVVDPTYAVWLERGAKLELRGFTLTGASLGVLCIRGCTILGGGGTITGAVWSGVQADTKLLMRDVTLRDNGGYGAATPGQASARLVLENGVVSGNAVGGLTSQRIDLRSSTVSDNAGYGTYSWGATKIRSSALGGNAMFDVWSYRPPKVRDSTCDAANWPDVCGP